MSGQSLVMVCGSEARGDSFAIHVRNPRGRFLWEIEDDLPPDEIQIVEEPIELPPPAVIPPISDGG
jgi:hypothetical protein